VLLLKPHEVIVEAAETVGREYGGWQGSGHGPDTVNTGGAVVQTGRLMGGPGGFDIFPNYPNQFKFRN
jgi:hypothetical protein